MPIGGEHYIQPMCSSREQVEIAFSCKDHPCMVQMDRCPHNGDEEKGNMKPLLSIVIANYNYGRFLEEAIQSVISQGMGDKVELIVCDAASNDNSVEIIKKYASGLPPNTSYREWVSLNNSHPVTLNSQLITWWCSEKDGGQSEAFNKGFSHARGEWITWLNADDFLMPGSLAAFERLVAKKKEAVWVTGNMVHFDSDSGKTISVHWGPHSQPPIIKGRKAFSAVFGPSTFWKRSLYHEIGPIDEKMHYAMDTEYWARLTMAGVRQTRLNFFCWAFRKHEDSKTDGVQLGGVRTKRANEAVYWKGKLGYDFKRTLSNIWYDYWCLWRFIDGSWIKRAILKRKYEGKPMADLLKAISKGIDNTVEREFRIRVLHIWVPEYRVPLYEGVGKRYPGRVEIQASQFQDCDSPLFQISGVKCDYDRKLLKWGPFYIERGLSLEGLRRGDVLVVDGNVRNILLMLKLIKARIKGLKVVWWAQHWTFGSNMLNLRLRILISRILSDVYLCYTNTGIDFLRKHGYRRERVFATGNTIDMRPIEDAVKHWTKTKVDDFKRKNGLLDKEILLLCGVLREKVRLQQLMAALSDSRLAKRSVALVVIGDGVCKDQWKALSSTLNVDSKVIWIDGMRDQMKLAPWFLAADIFAYPGAIGLGILHAFSYGLPVITHNNVKNQGPEYEAMEDGRTGLTFNENDVADMVNKIEYLLDHDEERQRMGRYAKNLVFTKYSMAAMIDNFCNAIETARIS